MYISYRSLKNDELDSSLLGKKVWQKDWLRQLTLDLENFGVKTKEEQEQWLARPTFKKLKIPVNLEIKICALNKRTQNVKCENENCNRYFHNKKEMNRHLKNDHKTEQETRDLATQPLEAWVPYTGGKPLKENYPCPLDDCDKKYVTVGRWRLHMKDCHPQVILREQAEKGSDSSEKPELKLALEMTEVKTDLEPERNEVSGESRTDSNGATPSEFCCQFCRFKCSVEKTLVNHLTTKHRRTYAKNAPVGKRREKIRGDRFNSVVNSADSVNSQNQLKGSARPAPAG